MKTKKYLQKIGYLAALLLTAATMIIPQRAAAAAIGVPMYEYPGVGTLWSDVLGADSNTVKLIIANPGSGPGASVDPTYTTYLNNAVSSGKRVLGYVYTSYQARNWQDVYNDIDDWYTMYPQISGIFIDLVDDETSAQLCYIASLYNHVKNNHPNDLVVLNPGTNISPDYEPYGDIFLNAENTFAVYQSSWSIMYPGWEDNAVYRNRFWHSVHTTDSSDLSTALSLMQTRNAGWMYVTDDTIPNPYSVTPSYWSTELTNVAALAATTIPNRGKTQLPTGCQDLTAATANTTTASTQQTKTASNITVSTNSIYPVEPTTRLAFSLPTGVTMAGTGTNWTCTGNNCNYGTTIGAGGSAQVLAAEFTTTCSYTGGNVSATLSNYAGNTHSFSVTPTRPSDCVTAGASSDTLADTGLSVGATTIAAIMLALAAIGIRFSRARLHYIHRTRR